MLKYSHETEIWFEISELSSHGGVKENTGFASLYLGKLDISISVRVFHFEPGSFWEWAQGHIAKNSYYQIAVLQWPFEV